MSSDSRRTTRKLAAIVVADVVHYSQQMGKDEVGTLDRLKALRTDILDPSMREHGGRLVKLMGDGLLAEFASAVDATEWAVAVQRAIFARNEKLEDAARMSLRIGVNVGDVILEEDDIYGDGVNVAARLEPLSPPGGICISAAVYEHVHNKIDADFRARGERALKNIARPVSTFCWSPIPLEEEPSAPAGAASAAARGRKSTVAVRVFEAAGGSEAAALAAAVHDSVIGALSNLSGLAVLADEARADYVAAGTIQAVAGRYRATMRLTDTRSGQQFWSDRFDGSLAEIFEAQDELTFRISQSLRFSIYDRDVAVTATIPEGQRSTEMLLARAGQVIAGANRHEWAATGPILDAVIAASPRDVSAHAIKSSWYLYEVFYGWREMEPRDRDGAAAAAREALRCNDNSDLAHITMALVHLYCERDSDKALREAERALELSPYYTFGRLLQGLAWVFGGEPERGMTACAAGVLANPRLVSNHRFLQGAGVGAWLLGRHDDAVEWAKRAEHQLADVGPSLLVLAAAAADAGRSHDAAAASARLLALFPDFHLAEMRRWPFRDAADHDRFVASLAAAGLPD